MKTYDEAYAVLITLYPDEHVVAKLNELGWFMRRQRDQITHLTTELATYKRALELAIKVMERASQHDCGISWYEIDEDHYLTRAAKELKYV